MPKPSGIKSLGAFTPRVDPALRARLASNGTSEPGKAGVTVKAATTTAPDSAQSRGGPPVRIQVELYLELIDDPQKCCPAFAYCGRKDPPDTLSIIVVLNRNLWPVAGALARDDQNALRWLAALAVLDRCLSWPSNPILHAVSGYLARAGLGETAQGYQRGLWAAYKLKDHRLFGLDPSILKEKPTQSLEKFAQFAIHVDSIRLEGWRAKEAASRKPRQIS